MDNKELKQVFRLTAALMELHGENSFKTRSYSNAAITIDRAPEQLSQMDSMAIGELKGIGVAIHEKILALLETGTFPLLERMLEKTPPGVLEIMKIKGLGPKKIKVLWGELGIETIGELLYACNENRLIALKGFGAKTQASVKQNIEYFLANSDRYHYAHMEYEASELLAAANEIKAIERIETTGELRRQKNVLDEMAFVVDIKGDAQKVLEKLGLKIEESEDNFVKARTESGAEVHLHLSDAKKFDAVRFETSAAEEHLKELAKVKGYKAYKAGAEEDYYQSLGLNFIPAAAREGIGETKFYKKKQESDLITEADIKGVVHAHSTYSDGRNTLKEMAEESARLGYEYLGISDHSKSAFYAGGLQPKEISKQHSEIDKLNKAAKDFHIFKSIESDILNDGSLDYDKDILESFDFIIASVHSVLKMDEDRATKRLITAIENPYTRILGHMTGRLLLSRKGYPVDHKKVIDACAANNVVIEVNANPHRLDIDWRWLPYCAKKGVMISINPDAHSLDGILDTRYGVISARKGMLLKQDTLNAKSTAEFQAWCDSK